MGIVFVLLVLGGVALYFMKPDERIAFLRKAVAVIRQGIRQATQSSPDDPFEAFLSSRTDKPVVTPLLVALNVLVFMLMFLGGASDDTQSLVGWGGNIAPHTTNGEWWRLVSSTFVHGSLFHLLATIAGLVPLGLILERAVGRAAFAAIYVTSGMLAGVVALWTTAPTSVTVGASGAVFGIYGLLLASLIRYRANPPEEKIAIPSITLKRLGGTAAFFVLYSLGNDYLGALAECAGLAAGFAGGLIVARNVAQEKAGMPSAALAAAVATVIAFAGAFPLQGIIDVRPELARLAALEERTAGDYDKAVVKYRGGTITEDALIQMIDRTIVPELRKVRAHLAALHGVPSEQAPLVAAASEYCELREQSWRRRAEGLHKLNQRVLRQADEEERAALRAFERFRPAT
jgi:membrane associated rhomboid family serine protease